MGLFGIVVSFIIVSSIIVSSIIVSSIIVSSIIVSPACGGLAFRAVIDCVFLLLFHPPTAGLQVRGVMQFGFYCCFTRLRRASVPRGNRLRFSIVVSPACGGLTSARCYAIRFLLLFHPPTAG
jgi:hypothetical protein